MYARLTTFNVGPGMRDFATGIADEAYGVVKDLNGFVSATYLVIDEAAGDYGSLTVWKTQADVEAANETLGAWLGNKLGAKVKAPPVNHTCEIYQPA